MKTIFKSKILSSAVLFGFFLFFVQCEKQAIAEPTVDDAILEERGGVDPAAVCNCLNTNYAVEKLSDEEIAGLLFMRQEEKLARDVYMALNAEYNQQIFTNIIRSEQQHMDAIGCLLEKYGKTDPIAGMEPGEFANADLAALYPELVAKGQNGLVSALQVGATIEDLDIADLQTWLDKDSVDNADIKAVFGELMRGSRNHLRAFVRNLGWNDATYTAQYIGAEQYQAILDGNVERGGSLCPGICDGNGTGKGLGKGNGNGTGNCDGTGVGMQNQQNQKQGNRGNSNRGNGRNG